MVTDLGKIFDNFTKKSLFKNKYILQSSYTPETIPHRDKQIKQIASILAPCLRLERPSNLFIYGKTGTGKTLSIHYVKNQLLDRAKKYGINLDIIYINCKLKKIADTEYRILAELIRKLGGDIPFTGLPTDQLYQKFTEIIDKEKKIFVIILDEIDQAVKKAGDEFLYNLTRLNTELKKAQISLVGISNSAVFAEDLDPRVKSSLSEEEIVFPPYNALQLKDILEERAKHAFHKNKIDSGVIAKCAAYAAQEHGDARRALDLLRIAGELAERDGAKKISFRYIDKAKEKIDHDRILDFVETQPKQFQLTLLSIINLTKSKKNKEKIFTGDIYNLYSKLCRETRTQPLTQRRISDILAEFDMVGIINARIVSKGRYGRTREITLSIPPTILEKSKKILKDSLNL